MLRAVSGFFFGAIFVFLFSACSAEGGNEESNVNEEHAQSENVEQVDGAPKEEDVTLLWLGGYTEEDFDELFRDRIEAQFPHITLELINEGLEEAITSQQTPDIITLAQQRGIPNLHDYDLDYDLEMMMEEHNFDLDRLASNLIKDFRTYDPDGRLLAVPFRRTTYVTHYNKDIFDARGVSYPEDNMSWSEIIELASEVTGEAGDQHYRGLDLDVPDIILDQMGVYNVDPETYEVLVTSDPRFREYMEMIDRVLRVPGNYPQENSGDYFYNDSESFMMEQTTAINPKWSMVDTFLEVDGFHFDIVTYPTLDDQPGVAPPSGSSALAISKHSDHIEEAWKVLEYVLSDAFQMENARNGIPTPLDNVEVQQALGENIPGYQDLNVEAMFKHEPHPGRPGVTQYDGAVPWWGSIADFAEAGQDIDQFLLEMQSAGEQNVQERMGSE